MSQVAEFLDRLGKVGRPTGWSVGGQSGLDVSIQTPVVELSITASYCRLPLRNDATNEVIMFQGGGVGAGLALSLAPPISASGSLDSFPSSGTQILRGPACPGEAIFSTFNGTVVLANIGASAGGNTTGTLAYFMTELPWYATPFEAIPGIREAAVLARCTGVALLYSVNIATELSVGVSAVSYVIRATGPVKQK